MFNKKTFDNIFDESYDLINDDISRWEHVINQVTVLSALPKYKWQQKVDSVQNIVDHNFNQIFKIADKEQLDFNTWLKTI